MDERKRKRNQSVHSKDYLNTVIVRKMLIIPFLSPHTINQHLAQSASDYIELANLLVVRGA